MIDLHIHSTASDGELSPGEIIDYAKSQGLRIIAITDHDTIHGTKEISNYAKEQEIELIPGVEFSTEIKGIPKRVHVLAFFFDINHEGIQDLCNKYLCDRMNQKKQVVERLKQMGYNITLEEVKSLVGDGVYGMPHIARILLKNHPKDFIDFQDVFEKILGEGKPAYINREKIELKEVIKTIHEANGISILAHPGELRNFSSDVIKKFIEYGGAGLEVEYPYESMFDEEESLRLRKEFRKIATENNFLITGGTDFHTKDSYAKVGEVGITEKEFLELKHIFFEKNIK